VTRGDCVSPTNLSLPGACWHAKLCACRHRSPGHQGKIKYDRRRIEPGVSPGAGPARTSRALRHHAGVCRRVIRSGHERVLLYRSATRCRGDRERNGKQEGDEALDLIESLRAYQADCGPGGGIGEKPDAPHPRLGEGQTSTATSVTSSGRYRRKALKNSDLVFEDPVLVLRRQHTPVDEQQGLRRPSSTAEGKLQISQHAGTRTYLHRQLAGACARSPSRKDRVVATPKRRAAFGGQVAIQGGPSYGQARRRWCFGRPGEIGITRARKCCYVHGRRHCRC